MENRIEISKKAQKDLKRVPAHIRNNFRIWTLLVEKEGISEIRKISGYHDETLSGDRAGQRSVRLSRAYRAFYIETPNGEITIIHILEVNKHDY